MNVKIKAGFIINCLRLLLREDIELPTEEDTLVKLRALFFTCINNLKNIKLENKKPPASSGRLFYRNLVL